MLVTFLQFRWLGGVGGGSFLFSPVLAEFFLRYSHPGFYDCVSSVREGATKLSVFLQTSGVIFFPLRSRVARS